MFLVDVERASCSHKAFGHMVSFVLVFLYNFLHSLFMACYFCALLTIYSWGALSWAQSEQPKAALYLSIC